ncbi:hypothetical protein YC2023_102556 [Brassica napus]
MAPSTHSNSKAMFRLADQKRTDSECTPLQILKPIVISEVIFMMLLATLGWLMVILSIHVQYYALRKAQLYGKILQISEGGFGSVYKAIINDPTATGGDSHYVPLDVAVKRFKR